MILIMILIIRLLISMSFTQCRDKIYLVILINKFNNLIINIIKNKNNDTYNRF